MAGKIVLVPHLNGIEYECERGLTQLEKEDIKVWRYRGASQIDVVRNEMASVALHDDFDSMMFIDADVGFDPADAIKLFNRPEPVIAGVYAKKSRQEMASIFMDKDIVFGPKAPESYPLFFTAAGFLRIQTDVLRHLITELKLPLCNTKWGRGIWPFFMPVIVQTTDGLHYLGEDWAFSYRLQQAKVPLFADTSFRLWHYGHYGFSWEDAGSPMQRFENYKYEVQK